jgi:hypothetical protein
MKVSLVLNQVPDSEGIWRNGYIDPRILKHNATCMCGQLHTQASLTPTRIQ